MNEQERFWLSDFGREYNKRNLRNIEKIENEHLTNFGIRRSELNNKFLANLRIDSILECGCGVGNQLLLLQHQNYKNLFGFDIQRDAINIAKMRLPDVTFIEGSLSKIPFKDNCFTLVFTSAVLIHIKPDNLLSVMDNIIHISYRYIWGYEFYNHSMTEADYRGHKDKLWKGDYCQLYLDNFPLKLIRRKKLHYANSDKNIVDEMFILEKVRS